MQEAKIWEEIEKKKAKERQLANLKNQNTLVQDNCPEREKAETRDILAEKVNLGSGKTYDRAKIATQKIDELKSHSRLIK